MLALVKTTFHHQSNCTWDLLRSTPLWLHPQPAASLSSVVDTNTSTQFPSMAISTASSSDLRTADQWTSWWWKPEVGSCRKMGVERGPWLEKPKSRSWEWSSFWVGSERVRLILAEVRSPFGSSCSAVRATARSEAEVSQKYKMIGSRNWTSDSWQEVQSQYINNNN